MVHWKNLPIGHLHYDIILLLRPESFRVLLSCANEGFCFLIVHTTCKLSNQHSTWKTNNQLCNFSIHFGGLFLFHCNYDIREIHISSKFYSELLQWWSEFRSVFDSRRECQYILWNNKEIRVDNKPVFYKKKFLKKMSFSSFVWIRHHKFFYYCFE